VTAVREAALRAVHRGWRVFPVRERGKVPLVGWQDQATTEPDQVRAWWSGRWRDANVGAIVPLGVVVVDVDPRHGGDDTLDGLEAEHGSLPPTLTAVTGSGGWHLWFSHPDAGQLRQGADVLGRGIDTRCAGRGFVVLPPSIHSCGATYRWADGSGTVAPLPGWMAEQLGPRPAREVVPLPVARAGGGRYGRAALAAELVRLDRSVEGRRNDDLHLAAVRVGQLVGAGHLDVAEAASALVGSGMRLGLAEREVEATVLSGLRFGTSHPRGETA
jgi:hypothetical protein